MSVLIDKNAGNIHSAANQTSKNIGLNDFERLRELVKDKRIFSARLLARKIRLSPSLFRDDGNFWLLYSRIVSRSNKKLSDSIRYNITICKNYSSLMYEELLRDDINYSFRRHDTNSAQNILFNLRNMPSYGDRLTTQAIKTFFDGKVSYNIHYYDIAVSYFYRANEKWELGLRSIEKEKWKEDYKYLIETRLYLLKAIAAKGAIGKAPDGDFLSQPHQNLIYSDFMSMDVSNWLRCRATFVYRLGRFGNFIDDLFI